MQGGDLDNRLPPRWLIAFEGVIGVHPTANDRQRFDWYMRVGHPKRAVRTFRVEPHAAKVLWDLTWRREMKFDVATFLPGARTEDHVREWLDRADLPVRNVRQYDEPAQLGKQLAYLPDVYAVVHADPQARFTYGDRGMLVTEGWTV